MYFGKNIINCIITAVRIGRQPNNLQIWQPKQCKNRNYRQTALSKNKTPEAAVGIAKDDTLSWDKEQTIPTKLEAAKPTRTVELIIVGKALKLGFIRVSFQSPLLYCQLNQQYVCLLPLITDWQLVIQACVYRHRFWRGFLKFSFCCFGGS